MDAIRRVKAGEEGTGVGLMHIVEMCARAGLVDSETGRPGAETSASRIRGEQAGVRTTEDRQSTSDI